MNSVKGTANLDSPRSNFHFTDQLDKQEILNEESIGTSNHQAEPVSLLWSNENHNDAFTFYDDDGAPSTFKRKPCSLPLLFYDENGESTTGSHFEFDFSSLSQSEVCDGNTGGYLGLASSPIVPGALNRQEATDSKNTSSTLGDVVDEAVCPKVLKSPP
ncbi:hypothetical protein FAGAP_136 [Fusarium agapanthi]|uniref:Uncharacterized protein n=1 Tax=Fusarium agapanthi TaxID=1803897 RepID=A0A9P5EI94_9HYPO|nr:hypothetical protein FAGAP_136 [Fusarium agapanthi]